MEDYLERRKVRDDTPETPEDGAEDLRDYDLEVAAGMVQPESPEDHKDTLKARALALKGEDSTPEGLRRLNADKESRQANKSGATRGELEMLADIRRNAKTGKRSATQKPQTPTAEEKREHEQRRRDLLDRVDRIDTRQAQPEAQRSRAPQTAAEIPTRKRHTVLTVDVIDRSRRSADRAALLARL